MNETIRRSQTQFAQCRQSIETSHEMIALSRRWLTAFSDSRNAEGEAGAMRHASVLNAIGIEFLLSDVDFAMTLMDLASITAVEETRQRSRQNARTAYDSVLRFLPRIMLNASQQHTFDEKLAILKTRLEQHPGFVKTQYGVMNA